MKSNNHLTEKTDKLRKEQNFPDLRSDEETIKPEPVIMDLPEVKDIPGQEHIHVPPLGELADTTISSDDEEGVSVFGNEDERDFESEEILKEENKKDTAYDDV